MKRFFTLLLTAVCVAISCTEPDSTVYGCTDYCSVQSSGLLVSDFGYRYNVLEQPDTDWKNEDRLYINFDVLEGVSVSEYDIRINSYSSFVMKDVAPERTGEDPVYCNVGVVTGISAPMLNISCYYVRKKGSTLPHVIDLVYDSSKSIGEEMYFELVHNAYGDTYAEGVDLSSCESVEYRVSFPIRSYLPEGVSSISVTVGYDWYMTDGTTTLPQTMHYTTSATVTM